MMKKKKLKIRRWWGRSENLKNIPKRQKQKKNNERYRQRGREKNEFMWKINKPKLIRKEKRRSVLTRTIYYNFSSSIDRVLRMNTGPLLRCPLSRASVTLRYHAYSIRPVKAARLWNLLKTFIFFLIEIRGVGSNGCTMEL